MSTKQYLEWAEERTSPVFNLNQEAQMNDFEVWLDVQNIEFDCKVEDSTVTYLVDWNSDKIKQ